MATAWNRKLMATDAFLHQYPFWLEALKQRFVSPRYFYCRAPGGEPMAYAALLAIGVWGFRIGVLNGGPIGLRDGEAIPDEALTAFWRRLRRSGYVCVRVANGNESSFQAMCRTCPTEDLDPFPWYTSTDHALIIDQEGSDEAVLARFKTQARAKIKKAAALGYGIEAADSPEAIRAAWPVIESMEARKGRQIFRRRRASYERLVELARPYGCARIYLARLGEKIVQIVLVVRDRDTAHYVLGALDVAALNKATSPASLVQWKAMREFSREGTRYYSLGNDNPGPIREFKHEFRPRRIEFPPIRVAILKPALYRFWKLAVSRLARAQREPEAEPAEVPADSR
jgi:hypothetical protein